MSRSNWLHAPPTLARGIGTWRGRCTSKDAASLDKTCPRGLLICGEAARSAGVAGTDLGRAIAYAAETPIGKIDHGDTESTEKRRMARFARRTPLLRALRALRASVPPW
jgi:hypothetical protein